MKFLLKTMTMDKEYPIEIKDDATIQEVKVRVFFVILVL
jgi:hypothetical protein